MELLQQIESEINWLEKDYSVPYKEKEFKLSYLKNLKKQIVNCEKQFLLMEEKWKSFEEKENIKYYEKIGLLSKVKK